ncbi:hypothetical protein RKD28_001286 [Streptomyces sp. SAI-229]
MPRVSGAPSSPAMFRATPKTMETMSAARMASPVIAPSSEVGMREETKPVNVACSVAVSGTSAAFSEEGSTWRPAPGWKMLATTSPISMDSSDSTRK